MSPFLEIKPKYWNHFDSIRRTNNSIEGFHSGLNKFISSKHPNIYKLVKQLSILHNSTSINYLAAKYLVDRPKQSKKEEEKDKRIENIKQQYIINNDLNQLLIAMGLQVQLPYESISDEPINSDNSENDTWESSDSEEEDLQPRLRNVTTAQPISSKSSTSQQPTLHLPSTTEKDYATLQTITDIPQATQR